jgi:prolyl oligopeptidase PreP (S9A serine peptidase family)
LVSINLADPNSSFVDVVPEDKSQVFDSVALVAGSLLVVVHSADANNRASIWDAKMRRKIRDIGEDELPDGVAVRAISARWDDDVVFLGFESFVAPLTILRGNKDTEGGIRFTKAIEPSIKGFHSSDYVTKQVNTL